MNDAILIWNGDEYKAQIKTVTNYGAGPRKMTIEVVPKYPMMLTSACTTLNESEYSSTEELIKRYFTNDVRTLNNAFRYHIKDVIFNDPATIVLWTDGTKTVVKCQNDDEYDPEKGLAMCIAKKALGNKGNYYSTFTKWLPEEGVPIDLSEIFAKMRALGESLKRPEENRVKTDVAQTQDRGQTETEGSV